MNNNEKLLIKKLKLIPHPEGGLYSERFRDKKGSVSLIYYLLRKGETSHWHKLKKNEILHFYDGDPIEIFLSKDKIKINKVILGASSKFNYHYIVSANTWFGMKSKGLWSLIGCVVAPAFEFSDLVIDNTNWKL